MIAGLYRWRWVVYCVPYGLPIFAFLISEDRAVAPTLAIGGGVLLALGEALRLWAAGVVGRVARSEVPARRALVTTGPYAWVRHPLYVGNVLSTAGVAFVYAAPALTLRSGAALVAIGVGGLVARTLAAHKERSLERFHGGAYRRYRANTPAFVPSGIARASGSPYAWSAAVRNEAHVIAFKLALVAPGVFVGSA